MHQEIRPSQVKTQVFDQLEVVQERSMTMHPRMVWILYYIEKRNVLLVCQRFSISKKTFYKWLKRYRDSGGNPASLEDIPRTPHHSPRATRPEIIDKIIQARKETGYGHRRLKRYLAQNHNISISEHTIWKLVKKHDAHNDGYASPESSS